MSAHSPYVVELIGEVVNSMRDYPDGEPYYIYDHPVAINQRLMQMSQSIEKKHKRFPLVALRMDFPEEVRGGVLHLNLNLRSEEHTSELQSRENLVCRLLLEKKKQQPAAAPVQSAIPVAS